jgi:FtsH-binding integral membrane protein
MNNYSSSIAQVVSNALYKTFMWMGLGLTITGLTSYFLSVSTFMIYFLNNSIYGSVFRLVILLSQCVLTFALFLGINKFSYSTLISLFLAFSAVTGMSMSVIFLIYELSSIIGIFFITAGMFFALSLYGLLTKKDLSPFYSFTIMFLFGIMAFSFINFFVKSVIFSKILLLAGIGIFSLLTAMDIQRLKNIFSQHAYDKEMQQKLSILGAVIMYQNFISLFLRLLSLFGKRKK